ncbi:retron St85 family RNA-directed DNA polymerase [Pseudoalteromonas sp. OANN1]|uniref:retron St85 family RNA-directed DNA polymerase n=1 Tax=Pseudoalteromonas sp. OANN1 TaxID=2954497 RepID=UPI002096C327|nr:retron St85 family RNA-directed DNA polymerase [Pseudoalteromonas sp. OANN1]MCO7200302.1 retron St85 family RNA-directed DNA polymerase [Pseudoalteromonas sp. OANN1]
MSLFKLINDLLLLSDTEFTSYLQTVPFRYKRFHIKKRNSNDYRQIAQPARAVKKLQTFAVNELKKKIPIHSAAMAYCEGRGIKQNAMVHLNSRYMLKMDLKSFFDSISPCILFEILDKHNFEYGTKDKFLISQLFFWKLQRNSPLRLSVGAPSSPFISNAIMYFFDHEVADYCKRNMIKYTRYADDLTFSTNKENVLKDIEKLVRSTLRTHFGKDIKVNRDKTVHTSKAHNRHVTGVTLSSENKLSIGRDRKRRIRAAVFQYCNNQLPPDETLKLKGYLGFAKHIEPDFIIKLKKKYGDEHIRQIQNFSLDD